MDKRKLLQRVGACALAAAMCVPFLAPTRANAASSRVKEILGNMTLKQKVEQMLMPDFRDWSTTGEGTAPDFTEMNDQVAQVLHDHDFGGVILFADNVKTTEQSFNLVQDLQAENLEGKDSPVPMLIGIDQEGGIVYRLGSGSALPGNMAVGATGDTEYAKRAGAIIGRELSALGINTDFAPVVDVNNNPNNPVIGLRSFGDDPDKVANFAVAMIEGINSSNVITAAKHFPGHGDTATDSHTGLPVVNKSYEELKNMELVPFQAAMDAGTDMFMVAHIAYPQIDPTMKDGNYIPATVSKVFLTDIARGDMGYDGVLITDAMNMAGLANLYTQSEACIESIKAGMDILLMPCVLDRNSSVDNLDQIIADIMAAVESGEIPQSRIDEAVTRILTLKEKRGILDYDPADYSLEKALAAVGSDENRQEEREISAAGVTVVKNQDNTLPIRTKGGEKVLLVGAYSNEAPGLELGFRRAQAAGLVDGVEYESLIYNNANEATQAQIKDKIAESDYVIVISELSGSSMRPGTWRRDMPEMIVNTAHELGKKSVVMSISHPYDVQFYDNADAIMAVYGNKGMDPTEGLVPDAAFGPNVPAGVEVAFGIFPAQGTLPVNIMEYDEEQGAFTDNVFALNGQTYANGYGLSYNALSVGDKGEITAVLGSIAGMDSSLYTQESWTALQGVVKEASDLLTYSALTTDEVAAMVSKLNDAIAALEEVVTPTVEPTAQPTVEPTAQPTAKPSEKPDVPQTGDSAQVLWYVAALASAVVCLGAATVAYKRSRR